MTDELQAVLLCDMFNWTYDEYMSQPNWFIEMMWRKRVEDGKEHGQKKKVG